MKIQKLRLTTYVTLNPGLPNETDFAVYLDILPSVNDSLKFKDALSNQMNILSDKFQQEFHKRGYEF